MVGTRTARMLAQYKAWADEVIFDGVAAMPPGEAEKERKTLFKSIIGTLNHSYVVDLIWQAHLERREHGSRRATSWCIRNFPRCGRRSGRSMIG
jgi:uncharacterized damage-inducible protein DinB